MLEDKQLAAARPPKPCFTSGDSAATLEGLAQLLAFREGVLTHQVRGPAGSGHFENTHLHPRWNPLIIN